MMIIGFSTSSSLLSRIIKWATDSKASHSYAVFDTDGGRLVIHSNISGVNTDYYSKFMNSHDIVAEYAMLIPEELVKRACACGMEKLDSPYDFCAIIGFGWVVLNRVFGRKIRNPFRNKSAYFCSELILMMLRAMGVQEAFKLGQETTSPEDLIQLLDKLPFAKRMM